jgi:hypothetical protein
MPLQEVLILAMTKMLSGICTAGFTLDPDPVTGLRWVRPVREFGSLVPGDLTDGSGRLLRCCDVAELNLLAPRADPPHVEDWVTDFLHHRPRLLRRLEGDRRARFLARYCDCAPEEVLVDHKRSLCLVRPSSAWASFALDRYSGKYEARMGFALADGRDHPQASSQRGVAVTDVKWRALGRAWLGQEGNRLTLDYGALCERLRAEALYLTLGLSRNWQATYWLLVVGVHVVPDYEAVVDLDNL